MEANDLLLFAKIADTGSFSKAAAQLKLPRSTVSRRIAQLESELGERLLLRTTRSLVLTDFGARLVEHARQLADEVEAATALAQHRQAEPSGRLRISMPSEIANMGLSRVLAVFMQRYPAITVELDLSPRRVNLIAEGFDVAIRMGQLADDPNLYARRVILEHNGLFASPAYLEQRGTPSHPDDLLAHDLLCVLSRNGGPVPWVLKKDGEVWQKQLDPRMLANSPAFLARVAAGSVGIAISSWMFVRELVEARALVPVLTDWELPMSEGWAVFPGRRLMPAKTRVFLDLIAEMCCDRAAPGRG